jgi:hypothetical protein
MPSKSCRSSISDRDLAFRCPKRHQKTKCSRVVSVCLASLSTISHFPPPRTASRRSTHPTAEHNTYWSERGGATDPTVYPPAFHTGYHAALAFYASIDVADPDELASESAHKESAKSRGVEVFESDERELGEATWEWQTGFVQGWQACRDACLVY